MSVGFAFIFILLSSSSSSCSCSATSKPASGCFESIVSFGDSLADTGNFPLLLPADNPPSSARPPYGRTFFRHPTGRCSDGRLVIDFIAESFGLPLVQPYLGREKEGRNFGKGVNFAVAGATALDNDFYEQIGMHNPGTNTSLRIQWDWFKQFLTTIPDSRKFLQKSLIVMGEIGGNDYNYPIGHGASLEVVQTFAPRVVNKIGLTIEALIKLGAKTILVPGIPPLGCLPAYLTQFKNTNSIKDYDQRTGCLSVFNKFTKYHNELLQNELNHLRGLYPHVIIIYADYYNAAMRLYISPDKFGFTRKILKACCGVGEPYNFNKTTPCGISPATSCNDPSLFASWDGMHFTEAAYKVITQGFFDGNYTNPQITTICPHISKASLQKKIYLVTKMVVIMAVLLLNVSIL